MPIKWFICPDNQRIEIAECLKEGNCKDRCATRSYLQLISKERKWTGKPSTTQLLSGTMYAFLKLTKDYAISPSDRAFMIIGTKGHGALEASDDEYSLLEESFSEGEEVSGVADVLEIENGQSVLVDYKTSGSYKVAKALGFYIEDEPTEEIYKSGKRKGEQKTRKILKKSDDKVDRWEWELQLNNYRMKFEKAGFKIDRIKIMCIVRDGGTFIARSRGVFRNIYYFNIRRIDDDIVRDFFNTKKSALLKALDTGLCKTVCNAKENWDGLRCQNYCEVAEFCPYGKYLKQEKEIGDMAIKGLSEIRRLPRLGKIRLGIKKTSQKTGNEYPAEVDYFILDPQTPSELENQKLLDEFHRLYGEKPKRIEIMFATGIPEVDFPQFYKRYGSSTLLKCKGDGETAVVVHPDFVKGLEQIGIDELGNIRVKCTGKECIYQKNNECSKVGVLQVLLPDLPGAGVWQIATGSFHSIVNINSGFDFMKAACGRYHMIPLALERVEEEIQYEGKKSKHYIMRINQEIRLRLIQEYAQIAPERMLLALPEPESDKEDILYQENMTIEPKIDPLPSEEINKAKEPINLRNEIKRMILEMTNNDDNRARAMLMQLTSFIPKGKTEAVKGKTHVSQLTDKQIPPTFLKVKELYERWQKSDLDKLYTAIQFATSAHELDIFMEEAKMFGIEGENFTELLKERDKRAVEISVKGGDKK